MLSVLKQIVQVFNYSNLSVEEVAMAIVLFISISVFGLNAIVRQQIISQKLVHKNRIQELQLQIGLQEDIHKYNGEAEQKYTYNQKAIISKIEIIKLKYSLLYKSLNCPNG